VDWRRREFVLDWPSARKLPWDTLLLFGGGLSLARCISETGVGEFIGASMTALGGAPQLLVVAAVIATVVGLTELTSNLATTATLLPILAGMAPGLGLDPVLLVVPAAISASCAFMLPVATPPNAIVFGTGRVSMQQMVRAGVGLSLLGIVLVLLLTYLVVIPLLGV
jgi:solute carrier family 13 (sodium-dependent dicarboxylate transporter), member 2/3/5